MIRPLDAKGNLDVVNGKIVLVSVGMSNTSMEFSRFKERADVDPAKNPRLVIVDGAQGGQSSDRWTDPQATTWQTLNMRLEDAGVTPDQVQIAWIKQTRGGSGSFPDKALTIQADLERIARNLKINFPNIQTAYFSSRTRAYTFDGLSPEPTAYESGFSVKWMIEGQLKGRHDLGLDVAPWLSWGPYLWADGTMGRSDEFVWECSDTNSDFTHPSSTGRTKVAQQLLAFFKTDPTAYPWFLRPSTSVPPIIESIVITPEQIVAGTTAHLDVSATDSDGIAQYVWTFGDGTFAYGSNISKRFSSPGEIHAFLTVVDRVGNSTTKSIPISIAEVESDRPPSAGFAAVPLTGNAPLVVSLDASLSSDDGKLVSFAWTFGDGTSGSGSTTSHTYENAGAYVLGLTVTDDRGQEDSTFRIITVFPSDHNQPPTADFFATPSFGVAPLNVIFDANASFDRDGRITGYRWDFGDGNQEIGGANITHIFRNPGEYSVQLTVRDDDLAQTTVSRTISVTAENEKLTVGNITAATGNKYQVATTGLAYRSVIYSDMGFLFGPMPNAVEGLLYIQTPYRDRRITTASLLSFQVNQDVTVFVGHDDVVPDPAWLSLFQDTGEDIPAGPVTFSLYRRNFPKGTVTLGSNIDTGTSGAQTMYIIIVAPEF